MTKQNVLNELMDKCYYTFGKKKVEIEKDIRTIEKLSLNIKDISNLNELRFLIGKKNRMGVMYLKKDNRFVNDQYEKLYRVLRKYDLIYEIKEDEENEEVI